MFQKRNVLLKFEEEEKMRNEIEYKFVALLLILC